MVPYIFLSYYPLVYNNDSKDFGTDLSEAEKLPGLT